MLYYIQSTNSYIRKGQPFTINGISYPANWISLSTKEALNLIGLTEVITIGQREDDSTHWVTEELEGATLKIINTPKDISMLNQAEISRKIEEIQNLERNSLLPRVLRVHLLNTLPTDSIEYDIVSQLDTKITELRTRINELKAYIPPVQEDPVYSV